MSCEKECLDCKHCTYEDIWYQLVCRKHDMKLCPSDFDGDGDVVYPTCKDFEQDERML